MNSVLITSSEKKVLKDLIDFIANYPKITPGSTTISIHDMSPTEEIGLLRAQIAGMTERLETAERLNQVRTYR